MRIAIVGGGIIGLSIARKLVSIDPKIELDIIDKFNIPSSGTSIRNSGVMHAGLYYKNGSLKAILCKKGTTQLNDYIEKRGLPIIRCGKILVPHSDKDLENMFKIKQKADSNGCTTELIGYREAQKIQPNIVEREKYLWSPKTSVFNPRTILNQLVKDLKGSNVKLIIDGAESIHSRTNSIKFISGTLKDYDFIFNVAGPGSLKLYKKDTGKGRDLQLVPILGEYAKLNRGPEIHTNLYPVPDPELPFLGIHLTPQTDGFPLIGPNAVPSLNSSIEEDKFVEMDEVCQRLGILSAMYIGNKNNFRNHAHSELCLSTKRKFEKNVSTFFKEELKSEVKMSKANYGIRPQLIDRNKLEFYNDFICDKNNNTLHVVNAVSPAFTSSFALADYLIAKLIK